MLFHFTFVRCEYGGHDFVYFRKIPTDHGYRIIRATKSYTTQDSYIKWITVKCFKKVSFHVEATLVTKFTVIKRKHAYFCKMLPKQNTDVFNVSKSSAANYTIKSKENVHKKIYPLPQYYEIKSECLF